MPVLLFLATWLLPLAARAADAPTPAGMVADLTDTLNYVLNWSWKAVLLVAGISAGAYVIKKVMDM